MSYNNELNRDELSNIENMIPLFIDQLDEWHLRFFALFKLGIDQQIGISSDQWVEYTAILNELQALKFFEEEGKINLHGRIEDLCFQAFCKWITTDSGIHFKKFYNQFSCCIDMRIYLNSNDLREENTELILYCRPCNKPPVICYLSSEYKIRKHSGVALNSDVG